jgi:hypothetical protein
MKVHIAANGILKDILIEGWNDDYCDFINLDPDPQLKARPFDNAVDAIFRKLYVGGYIRRLAIIYNRFRDDDIIGVGHSDGAYLHTEATRIFQGNIAELHLIAAACDADFDKNGLNDAVEAGKVKRICCYCSEHDTALLLAGSFFGKLLGWGDLGRRGPQNMTPEAARVTSVIWRNDLDHCDWVNPQHLVETKNMILGK